MGNDCRYRKCAYKYLQAAATHRCTKCSKLYCTNECLEGHRKRCAQKTAQATRQTTDQASRQATGQASRQAMGQASRQETGQASRSTASNFATSSRSSTNRRSRTSSSTQLTAAAQRAFSNLQRRNPQLSRYSEREVFYTLRTTFTQELLDLNSYTLSERRDGFRDFLRMAKTNSNILPPWWNREAREACVEQL